MTADGPAEPTLSGHGYRHEGEYRLIEIALREPRQMFNTLDPAPFREKDLNAEAEDYIVGALREIGPARPVKLVLHLPEAALALPEAATLVPAVHNHFRLRAVHTGKELRQVLKVGAISLCIGLTFLGVCVSLREFLPLLLPQGRSRILDEGLLIIGWVALWRPVEVFLYDWWPVRRRLLLYRKLACVPVDVRGRPAATPPAATQST